jgi:hypothetical protein
MAPMPHPSIRIELFDSVHQRGIEVERSESERLRVAAEGGGFAGDYVAIDAGGKVVAGPFKHYDQARKEADKHGGLVRFAAESPLDAVSSGVQTIQALRGGGSGASDYPTLEAALLEAQKQGAVYWSYVLEVPYALFPTQDRKVWQARAIFYASGKYHIERRGEFVKVETEKVPGHWKTLTAPRRSQAAASGKRPARRTPARKPVTKVTKPVTKAAARDAVPVAHERRGKRGVARDSHPSGTPPVVPYIHCTRNVRAYRAALAASQKMPPVRSAVDVHRVLWPILGKEDQEIFGVLMFDVRNQCIGWHEVARGARDHVEVPIGRVFAPVTQYAPHHYLIVHNHPSGKADPSKADALLTRDIEEAARPYSRDCAYVDHVILGVGECYSFRDKKLHRLKG